jgi:hypothetical protein
MTSFYTVVTGEAKAAQANFDAQLTQCNWSGDTKAVIFIIFALKPLFCFVVLPEFGREDVLSESR